MEQFQQFKHIQTTHGEEGWGEIYTYNFSLCEFFSGNNLLTRKFSKRYALQAAQQPLPMQLQYKLKLTEITFSKKN